MAGLLFSPWLSLLKVNSPGAGALLLGATCEWSHSAVPNLSAATAAGTVRLELKFGFEVGLFFYVWKKNNEENKTTDLTSQNSIKNNKPLAHFIQEKKTQIYKKKKKKGVDH